MSAVSNARTNLCRLRWFASPDVFIAWYRPVFPLGQLGVVAELLRRRRARRLHLFRHGGKELHVIPPRVVEHVRKRSFARARGADGRAVRVLVLVLVDGRSVRARVVGFVLLRRRRARFHGEVGVKLPQEVQPRAKFADGGSLDVLLEREGHLTQTLALLRGESRRVPARQQRRGGHGASASASFSSASSLRRDGVFFGGRRSARRANHVRCARAACRSAARAKSLGHVLSSLCRHLSANFAHAVSSSLRLTCDAAPSSHVCARASKSSRPVSACFSGLSSGNAKTRSQISASWDSKGCSALLVE